MPPQPRAWTAVVLAALLSSCQQADQLLPFELAEGEGATLTLGADGGIVSVPPSFSIDFPAGALTGTVTVEVTPRIDEPFPSDAGVAVPGTAFDITPAGTALSQPATVELAVDPVLLEAGEEVRLSLAVLRPDATVVTYQGSYDVTNGVLAAEVDELGPVAAVVSADAVPVAFEPPPTLGGGAIPQPSAPAPSGPAASSHGGVEFSASCAPDDRECYSSGLIRLWADEVVRERMGEHVFLLGASAETSLEFLSFDANGLPTEIVGSVRVDGDLRARLNSTVSQTAVADDVSTGPSMDPSPTPLLVSGNVLIVSQTSNQDGSIEFNEEIEFAVTGIGTSEMLVIEAEAEIEFDNDDGSVTIGIVTAHLRLRR